MNTIKTEILDWIRLKRKSKPNYGAMVVGDVSEEEVARDNGFLEGYDKALDDMKEIVETL